MNRWRASGSLDLTFNYRRNGTRTHRCISGSRTSPTRDCASRISPPGSAIEDLVYPQDYPLPGRRWWLSVGYAF